ncbi:MAG: hypothetical protein WDN69_06310 [Aliidongia sp.]
MVREQGIGFALCRRHRDEHIGAALFDHGLGPRPGPDFAVNRNAGALGDHIERIDADAFRPAVFVMIGQGAQRIALGDDQGTLRRARSRFGRGGQRRRQGKAE